MKNSLTDLRNHLFATLEALQDEEKPMDIARARAVSEVAQTVIDSARVEIEFMQLNDEAEPSEFFEGKRLEMRPVPAHSLAQPARLGRVS